MGTRREARERAVQFLFQFDLNPTEDLEAALSIFWEGRQLQDLPDGNVSASSTRGCPCRRPLRPRLPPGSLRNH
jgi:transcription termination factor NusB